MQINVETQNIILTNRTFEEILSDTHVAKDSERHLPAFTALDRDDWADFREKHTSTGINKRSMDAIDTAAFVVILDTESRHYGNVSSAIETLNYIPRTDYSYIATCLIRHMYISL